MKDVTGKLNANVSLKVVSKNGKEYNNIFVTFYPKKGEPLTFEVAPKFANRRFIYKLVCSIKEAK